MARDCSKITVMNVAVVNPPHSGLLRIHGLRETNIYDEPAQAPNEYYNYTWGKYKTMHTYITIEQGANY